MQDLNDSAKIVRLEEKVKYLEERAHKSEQEMLLLKGDLEVYKAASVHVKNMLHQIHTAIIGDELGNVGVVKRLANVEKVVAWINSKKSYLWGIVAATGGVIGFVMWVMDWLYKLLK